MPRPQAKFPLAFGTFLFLATATFVLWQNAHVAVLWDLSYLLDSSWRIANGQVPYRDFPFAHAPLTFLIQAAIIKLTGRVYFHHILYAALAGATATVLTWRILLGLLRERIPRADTIATLLAATLIPLGIYSIYPHPEYDGDAALCVLLAIYLLQRAFAEDSPSTWLCIIAGASTILPVFAKQNIGLFFLAATGAVLAVLVLMPVISTGAQRSGEIAVFRTPILILTGAATTLALALLTLHLTAGLANYLHWTISFAAQRRLPGLSLVLGTYHQTSLLWTIPTTLAGLALLHKPTPRNRVIATALLAAPFVWVLVQTPFLDDAGDRADAILALWPHLLLVSIIFVLFTLAQRRFSFAALLPVILLATIHGTFLSQQLWGSTYAQWPLLLILVACLWRTLPPPAQPVILPLTSVIAATLLFCGTPYALSHDRLSYIHLDGPIASSTTPALRGMHTPGPWLPQLDELIADTNRTIPRGDTVMLFPGQDPFFYATGRVPTFPVLMIDPATNPFSPQQLAAAAAARNVRWLIVPKALQLTAHPVDNYDDFLAALAPLFTPDHTTSNYSIYHRK